MKIIEKIVIYTLAYQIGGCSRYPFNFSASACLSLLSTYNSSTIEVSCENNGIAKSVYEQLNISIISNEAEIFCRSSTYGRRRMSGNTGIYHIKSHNTLDSIVDLMIYWRRKIAAFLYDDYSGFHPKQTLQYLQNRSIRASFFSVDRTTDLDVVILNSTKYQNIVIICHPKLLNKIIKKAKVYDLLSKNFTWIIVNGETPEAIYGVDIPPNSQVTLISPKPFVPYFINEPQYDLPNVNKIRTWNNISNTYLCQKHIKPSITEIEIRLKSQDKMAAHLMASPTVNMYDIFFSPTTGRTETIKFADWKPNRKNKLLLVEIFHPNDKLRLRARRVRVVVFQHIPYSTLTKSNGAIIKVDGYVKDMMDTLLTNYNLRYTLREIPDIFGIGINGTYTGMVGVFYNREADLAMNVLALTNSRAQAVRYAGPLTKAHLAIIYSRPQSIIPPTTYLMPFSMPVWIVIIVGIIVILFATFLTLSMSPVSNDPQRSTQSQTTHKRIFRVATLTYIDEVMDYPLGGAAKVIHGTLLLSTLAVFIHYTSTFTAFLAYQEEHIPFKSIEDVVERKDYDILMLKNGRHQDMFQYAPPGPYLEVWNRVVKQGERSFSRTFETAYEDFCHANKVVLLSDGPTTTHLSSGNCSVTFAPARYMQEYYNTPHRNDFPYTKLFTTGLLKILESGILKRLTLAYELQDRAPCYLENTSNSFGISQVMGVFVLHACGILLSLLALIVERHLPKRLPHLALKNRNNN